MLGVLITKIKVRQGFRQFSNHELEKFLANWRDDAYLVYPGDVPASGRMEGKPAIEKWFRNFFEQFTYINFTVNNVCVDNIFDLTGTNAVAVYWDFEGTNRDGYSVKNNGFTMLSLKFGKVTSARDFFFNTGTEFRMGWGVK